MRHVADLPSSAPPAADDGASFRSGLLPRVVPLCVGYLCALAVVSVLAWHEHQPMLHGGFRTWAVGLPVTAGIAALVGRGYGLRLTPEEAVVHGVRRRAVPWPEVRGITVESQLGVRTVVFIEADGRRTRLRAPTSFLDRGFDDKVRRITDYWDSHRVPGAAAQSPGCPR